MTKPSDSAILNLGDIGEENTFTSTTDKGNISSTVHSFEDKVPDSALDPDDEGNRITIRKFSYSIKINYEKPVVIITTSNICLRYFK